MFDYSDNFLNIIRGDTLSAWRAHMRLFSQGPAPMALELFVHT